MVDLLIKLGLGRGNSSIGGSIAIKNDQKIGKLGFFLILPTRSLPIFDQKEDLEWHKRQKTLSKDRLGKPTLRRERLLIKGLSLYIDMPPLVHRTRNTQGRDRSPQRSA
jgi:hypothetical protein